MKSNQDQPRDYDPKLGGLVLCIGGSADAEFRYSPAGKCGLVVRTYKKISFEQMRREVDLSMDPTFDNEIYHLSELYWWTQLATRSIWILLHSSLDPATVPSARILRAERRALERTLPPAESCAVPMKPGPLSLNTKIEGKEVVSFGAISFGMKIPNPWLFGGFTSV